MVESERGILFPLSPGVIDRVRRVGVRRFEAETQNVSVRAFTTVLCAVLIDWSRLDMAGWYPYDCYTRTFS